MPRRDSKALCAMTIPGDPVGKGRHRTGKGGRTYTPQKTRAWTETAAIIARLAWRKRAAVTGPIRVDVAAYKTRPKRRPAFVPAEVWASGSAVVCPVKPDRDNIDKACLDALVKAGVLHDDALVVDGRVRKLYAAKGCEPCVVVEMYDVGWTP